MNIRTIGDRILVEPKKSEERTTEGGIVLPAGVTGRGAAEAVVVEGKSLNLKRGARVLFTGAGVRVGESGMMLVEHKDVLGVYEGG